MTCPSLSTLRSLNEQVRSVHELLKSAVGAALLPEGSGSVESLPQPAATAATARINPSERHRVGFIHSCRGEGSVTRRAARPGGHRRTGNGPAASCPLGFEQLGLRT